MQNVDVKEGVKKVKLKKKNDHVEMIDEPEPVSEA